MIDLDTTVLTEAPTILDGSDTSVFASLESAPTVVEPNTVVDGTRRMTIPSRAYMRAWFHLVPLYGRMMPLADAIELVETELDGCQHDDE